MKLIKNIMRSIMTDDRLSALEVISIAMVVFYATLENNKRGFEFESKFESRQFESAENGLADGRI